MKTKALILLLLLAPFALHGQNGDTKLPRLIEEYYRQPLNLDQDYDYQAQVINEWKSRGIRRFFDNFFLSFLPDKTGKNNYIPIDSSYFSQLNQLIKKYNKIYGSQSKEYAESVLYFAMICCDYKDYVQAERFLDRGVFLLKQNGDGPFQGRDTISEIFMLDVKSKIEYATDSLFFALKRHKRACKLKKQYFGDQSVPYLGSVLGLSRLYGERMRYGKSVQTHNEGFQSYVQLLKHEFCQQTESERSNYWQTARPYISRTLDVAYQTSHSRMRRSVKGMANATYDALLLSKGILLNTTRSFEDYVLSSGNEAAIMLLEEKKNISNKNADAILLDSIDRVILNMLAENNKSYTIPHLSITWRDVQEQLHPDDVAIEFFCDSRHNYGAVIIRRDWKSPILVPLKNRTNGNSLDNLLKSSTSDNGQTANLEELWTLSKAIWTDELLKHFPKTDTGHVYFSTDGELQVIGIENLPFVSPKRQGNDSVLHYTFADIYPMYRLSSTRELVTAKRSRQMNKAAIYGGLIYDMDLGAESCSVPNTNIRSNREALHSIPYLAGTKKEADDIIAILQKDRQTQISPFTSTNGTEESLKQLGGQKYNLLHIATHGFAYSASDSAIISRLQLGSNALSHTGLLMAGADSKWFGDYIPEGKDDGFVTSLEISSIDFNEMDLVVLSACETGKGMIADDGVFGLQRGFKMAGVNSILMSLWKVDDDATCTLMTEFYRNWTSGMEKHDALERAKQTVRNTPKWKDPKYWAAFILLDAIDK
ncbi:MAG: CHAT domain-containing protein [Bacteroidales bacterium]|nr:CHAT domain-containing protein [Bacteroidales bacterium]